MVVLVIAAHPDDEVLGCGGVMARHAAQGDEVHVLVVTRGVPELFPPDVIEGTRVELRAAHEVLGVQSCRFLDFPAPQLDTVPLHRLVDTIGGTVRELQPLIVYTPHRGDLHADHRIVHHTTLIACRPVNNCPVQRVLAYETLSETDWAPPTAEDAFVPTVFVDISDYLERKLQAMDCYRSQLKAPPQSRSLRSLEALARLRGGTVSVHAAEGFMLVREIVL